jgi:hypothetical protein
MQEGRGGFDGRRALERLVARYPVLKSDEAVASVLAHEGRGIEESGFIEVAQELLLLRSQVGVAAIGCFRPLLPRLLDGVLQSLRQLRRHGIGRSGQQADGTRRLRGEWTLDLHEDASILFSRILELAPYLLRYKGFLVFSTNIILFSSGHREGIAITPKNKPHADFSVTENREIKQAIKSCSLELCLSLLNPEFVCTLHEGEETPDCEQQYRLGFRIYGLNLPDP